MFAYYWWHLVVLTHCWDRTRHALHVMTLKPGGNGTMVEHAEWVLAVGTIWEKKVMKAFVQGLREKHRRTFLKETLKEKGWTGTYASEEISAMIEKRKKNKSVWR